MDIRKLFQVVMPPPPVVSELYVLVHPFYNFSNCNTPRHQWEQFENAWEKSAASAAKRPGCFAIVYLDDVLMENPPIEKVRRLRISKESIAIAEFIHTVFGRDRCLFIAALNLAFPKLAYEKRLEDMLDKENVHVSIRGVYADGCVSDARIGIRDAYDIPEERISIVYSESVFAERRFSNEHGLPENLLVIH